MEELHGHKATNKNGNAHSHANRGFSKAIRLLSLLVLFGIIAQNLKDWLTGSSQSAWVGTLAGWAVLAVFAVLFFRTLYTKLDTPHFAISGLLGIAFGTALGTFVSQNASPEVFTQRYGETGSTVLRFFQMDDVFHSWWYVSLFAVLVISLVKISWKKKFGRENLGFHLAHLSPVIILLGFWIDHFYGYKGIIQLETGESKSMVSLYGGPNNQITDSTALPFRIRLDHFEFEKHDPDYRLQIWRQDTSWHAQHTSMGEKEPEILASLPPVPMKIYRIYGTNLRFRLKEFFPNFYFDYSYPKVTDTIAAKSPGIMMDIKTPVGDATVQLRSDLPERNVLADYETLGAWLEFHWETPANLVQQLEKISAGAGGAAHNKIVFAGKERLIYASIGGKVSTEKIETGKFYPLPDRDSTGFVVRYVFPDAAYLKAVPANKSNELLNPVAKVEVWDKTKPGSEETYLYPGLGGRKSSIFQIPGSPYFLAFESLKDKETKYFRSDLSVLGSGDEVLKQQSIKVNEPMLHGGHRFYQTDYDPDNPTYSGIGVTHEPGLYIIYFGFYVLVLGCAMMFYGRSTKASA
jgi:hypothetical protein